ncbi:Uncharacterised protein [Mycobacteroides abscessus subsp. abscessus]|nr:Uncharacterised protein [Mycobacteroides abscessus subsp. abscessus]
MTTRSTASVMMLPSRGRPAVTATSWRRPMSPTSRCEVSPIDAREWYFSDSAWMWSKTRVRSWVATRAPTRAKQIVEA